MKLECQDSLYGDIIEQYFWEEFPGVEVREELRFEALSKEVFGTKQRRNGPMPKPEQQVEIRDLLRRNKHINFFVAWGSRKQEEDQGFDVLEFTALKQLYSLRDAIRKCGWDATFYFRIEDLTDDVIFSPLSWPAITDYSDKMLHFAAPLGVVKTESELGSPDKFFSKVKELKPLFHSYLTEGIGLKELKRLGWVGEIPQAQRNYYSQMYKTFYPTADPLKKMAEYFAICLTRTVLDMKGLPPGEFIQISFTSPVPGDPIPRKRVNYRSIPERFTHIHRPPWLGKGYLSINDDGYERTVTPKVAGFGERLNYIKNSVVIDGLNVEADYVVE